MKSSFFSQDADIRDKEIAASCLNSLINLFSNSMLGVHCQSKSALTLSEVDLGLLQHPRWNAGSR